MTQPKPPAIPDADGAPEGAESWLDPASEAALATALRAAFAPEELDAARHATLLALALEDPLAPASEEEVRESERLRDALEGNDASHAGAALARALRAAAAPAALDAELARRLAERAAPRRTNVVYVAFGAVALAAAAAFALVLTKPPVAPPASAALLRSRTTQDLFHERFEPGQASARIDRIASARERDGRENRYALWGVR